jgi:hypothetical protein
MVKIVVMNKVFGIPPDPEVVCFHDWIAQSKRNSDIEVIRYMKKLPDRGLYRFFAQSAYYMKADTQGGSH